MLPLPLGRRVLPLTAAAVLAGGVYAASSPSVAAASDPVRLTCSLPESAWNTVTGITLCHEGFEIQIFERHADGRVSGRVHAGGGWDPFTARPAGATNVKAVVVLIGANNYG